MGFLHSFYFWQALQELIEGDAAVCPCQEAPASLAIPHGSGRPFDPDRGAFAI
jgi:hypothetical protein